MEELVRRRKDVGGVHLPDDASVVLFGSWGRQELTSESDNDWVVLAEGPIGEDGEIDSDDVDEDALRSDIVQSVDELEAILSTEKGAPGTHGVFGTQRQAAALAEAAVRGRARADPPVSRPARRRDARVPR